MRYGRAKPVAVIICIVVLSCAGACTKGERDTVRFSVRVYDGATKQPIAGAKVKLYRERLAGEPFAVAMTDARGLAHFEAGSREARPGVDTWWVFVASAPGYEEWTVEGNTAFRRDSSIPLQKSGASEVHPAIKSIPDLDKLVYSLRVHLRDAQAKPLYVILNSFSVKNGKAEWVEASPHLWETEAIVSRGTKAYKIDRPSSAVVHELRLHCGRYPDFENLFLQIVIWELDKPTEDLASITSKEPAFLAWVRRPDLGSSKAVWSQSTFATVVRGREGRFRLLAAPSTERMPGAEKR